MGKSKGGARRKGGKGDAAKVASKATSTLSKRQEKKSQVRKAAARERKGALLSQLETRKAADAAAARTTNAAVHRGRYITGRRAGRGISETSKLRRRDEDQNQARNHKTTRRGLRQT